MREVKYRVYDKNKNRIFQVIRLCKSFERLATHSRDFSHELVATYVNIKT